MTAPRTPAEMREAAALLCDAAATATEAMAVTIGNDPDLGPAEMSIAYSDVGGRKATAVHLAAAIRAQPVAEVEERYAAKCEELETLREQMGEWRTEVYRLRALAHSLCCCGPIADALDGCRVHPHGAEGAPDPALTEARDRAEKAEAENKRMRAELAEYRDADRERKDIL